MPTTPPTTPKDIAVEVPVTAFLSHRDYLAQLYAVLKKRNKSYSYLQLAVDLGFGPTNLVRLFITGKRALTSKAAERVALALGLHGPERRFWTHLVKHANARSPSERDRLLKLLMSYKTQAAPVALSPLQAAYFSEWYHPVIREMTALTDFIADPTWIQRRLAFPLRLEQIKKSLQLLVELGVVEQDQATGKLRRSAERIATESEVDSLALVRYHQKMLEVASQSITAVAEDRRDIRAATITVSEATLGILKQRIESMILELAAMEDSGGEDVVQVNIQMFPFTKSPRGGA